jgi:hypothetical protein
MRYRHKLTGVVIDVNSEMKGDWEPVETAPEAPKKEAPAPEKKRKKAADGLRKS